MKRTVKSIALILAAVMIIAMFPVTASAASYKPGKVKVTSISVSKVSGSSNTATVTIKWKRVSKATGYWVYEKNENGKWVLLKKLGKSYTGIKVKKVYAGQRAFKVRAVRKVGSKTYKGNFSAIQSRFIKSPLNFEKLLKLEGEETEYTEPLDGTGASSLDVSIKGNIMKMTYSMMGDASNKPDADAVSSFFSGIDERKSDLINICRTARLGGGVKGVKVIVALSFNGEVLNSKEYKE